jgi:hypothetical protein
VVHADLTTLAEREPGRSEIEDGPSLSADALERPRGKPMPEVSLPPPRTDAGAIRREHAKAGTRIRPDTITSEYDALERLDLHHAVAALRHLDPPDLN